ncbi:acyltransferase family protein [Rhizobium ruizarguesonis]
MFQRYDFEKETTIIDALRGIAALLVLVSHADAYYLIRWDAIAPYKGHLGEVGVCLFFLLSGFLIWSSALRQLDQKAGLWRYAVNRIARVMPLYYIALIFAVTVFPIASSYPVDITLANILRVATFTQAVPPDVSGAINPVLWTLTYEILFYLCAPFLFALGRFFPLFIVAAVFSAWHGYRLESPIYVFYSQMPLFVAGMTLAQYRIIPTRLFAEGSAALALVAGVVGVTAIPVCALWAFCLFAATAAVRHLRDSRAVVALAFVGECSYSLYIWHYMLIEIVGPVLMKADHLPERYPLLTAILFTAFTIGISWISYRWIERPLQIRTRSLLLTPRLGSNSTVKLQDQPNI